MSVSTRALTTLTDQFWAHRAVLGSRWRQLSVIEHALLALAHLRTGETYGDLADEFGVGTSTASRHVREAVDLLATLAPPGR